MRAEGAPYRGGGGMFSSAKKGTMKGRGKRGKREEKSERARGKGKKKGKKREGGGRGRKREKMEEILLNGGEGFQEASWGVGNVFKKFEEYTPLLFPLYNLLGGKPPKSSCFIIYWEANFPSPPAL